MCGITGFIDFRNRTDKKIIEDMISTLHHRGPDDGGVEYETINNCQIGLAHKRLSIMDLSKRGHQPYKYMNLTIVYNGEIYNFLEIKKELKTKGYKFDSHSDTEIIIKAYHCWKEKAIKKFNGMFAFAIFDNEKGILTLVRDRAGVKPLYWYFKDDLFMFTSELKSFHQHTLFNKSISNNSVGLYLQYGYVPQPFSIFEYVKKLENGHILTLNLKTKEIKNNTYWSIYYYYKKEKLQLSEDEALKELDNLINSSIKYRMISDVPIGSFLSGGYDSSLVTAIMQKNSNHKIKTFTIGFENDKFDESSYARDVAKYLGTDHTEYICTAQDTLDILPELSNILDEPMADTSVIPTLIVSKLAKQKVSVSLSADGGDELFAGYNAYRQALKIRNITKKIPFSNYLAKSIGGLNYFVPSKLNKINRRLQRVSSLIGSKNSVEVHKALGNTFLPNDIIKLLKNKPTLDDENLDIYKSIEHLDDGIDLLLAKDFQSSQIDQLLVKVDRATMHYSLEGREPLLDYRLIEFAAQLPEKFKVKNDTGKYLLKKLTHKYIPKEIMDRPKMGFSVPIDDWFKNSFHEFVKNYLDDNKIKEQNIFVEKEVYKIKTAYFKGNNINMQQLWNILVFQMWYEKWNN